MEGRVQPIGGGKWPIFVAMVETASTSRWNRYCVRWNDGVIIAPSINSWDMADRRDIFEGSCEQVTSGVNPYWKCIKLTPRRIGVNAGIFPPIYYLHVRLPLPNSVGYGSSSAFGQSPHSASRDGKSNLRSQLNVLQVSIYVKRPILARDHDGRLLCITDRAKELVCQVTI